MKTITTRAEMQCQADAWRSEDKTIALVPTMGALHDGHLALVQRAKAEADIVVVSIFVNPTQFTPGEDYDRYPRNLERDLEALRPYRIDTVFAPPVDDVYPFGPGEVYTHVIVDELTTPLCGAHRAGHFRGVTTVVTKLLLACKPHTAIFGMKDAQQFFVLRRMVTELGFDVKLVGVPTVRESNGLAMSSRNAFLSDAERHNASVIAKSLKQTKAHILAGELEVEPLVRQLTQRIEDAGGTVQYAELVETGSLSAVTMAQPHQELLIAVAVFFGSTRLIDNVIVTVPAHPLQDVLPS
ncbi:MAG: pantoate--beta-alanine ligase [Bacteroidota bacterium]